MSEKKKGKIQFFRPKDLKRIVETLPKTEGVHPTSEDLKSMASDTIKNVSKYQPDKDLQKKAIEDSKQTIADVNEMEKKNGGKP